MARGPRERIPRLSDDYRLYAVNFVNDAHYRRAFVLWAHNASSALQRAKQAYTSGIHGPEHGVIQTYAGLSKLEPGESTGELTHVDIKNSQGMQRMLDVTMNARLQ